MHMHNCASRCRHSYGAWCIGEKIDLLKRLGRRACSSVFFVVDEVGDEEGCDGSGEVEYDDPGDELPPALSDWLSWQRSISMADGGGAGMGIEEDMAGG